MSSSDFGTDRLIENPLELHSPTYAKALITRVVVRHFVSRFTGAAHSRFAAQCYAVVRQLGVCLSVRHVCVLCRNG